MELDAHVPQNEANWSYVRYRQKCRSHEQNTQQIARRITAAQSGEVDKVLAPVSLDASGWSTEPVRLQKWLQSVAGINEDTLRS